MQCRFGRDVPATRLGFPVKYGTRHWALARGAGTCGTETDPRAPNSGCKGARFPVMIYENKGRYSRPLLDGAGDVGEHSVRIAADQPHCSHDNDQNDGHHDRVFGYILTGLFRPQVAKILSHSPPVCWRVDCRRSEGSRLLRTLEIFSRK